MADPTSHSHIYSQQATNSSQSNKEPNSVGDAVSSTAEKICAVCQIFCTLACAKCKTTYYCSAAHQKQDWRTHKATCNVSMASLQKFAEEKGPEFPWFLHSQDHWDSLNMDPNTRGFMAQVTALGEMQPGSPEFVKLQSELSTKMGRK